MTAKSKTPANFARSQIDPKIKEIENTFSGASLDSDSIKLKNEKIE